MQTVKVHFLDGQHIFSTQFITATTAAVAIAAVNKAVALCANECIAVLRHDQRVIVRNNSTRSDVTHCIAI